MPGDGEGAAHQKTLRGTDMAGMNTPPNCRLHAILGVFSMITVTADAGNMPNTVHNFYPMTSTCSAAKTGTVDPLAPMVTPRRRRMMNFT